jgi:hypothetical protein
MQRNGNNAMKVGGIMEKSKYDMDGRMFVRWSVASFWVEVVVVIIASSFAPAFANQLLHPWDLFWAFWCCFLGLMIAHIIGDGVLEE